jgi:DNA-binding transcriptional MerR regulator
VSSAAEAAAAATTPEKLYRIGEVCRLTNTKAFVLRYWETEFPMLQPVKTPSGHRLYRREDIALVLEIKRLLYEEGFTIAGARRHLAGAQGNGQEAAPAEAAPRLLRSPQRVLLDLRSELEAILTLLERR